MLSWSLAGGQQSIKKARRMHVKEASSLLGGPGVWEGGQELDELPKLR